MNIKEDAFINLTGGVTINNETVQYNSHRDLYRYKVINTVTSLTEEWITTYENMHHYVLNGNPLRYCANNLVLNTPNSTYFNKTMGFLGNNIFIHTKRIGSFSLLNFYEEQRAYDGFVRYESTSNTLTAATLSTIGTNNSSFYEPGIPVDLSFYRIVPAEGYLFIVDKYVNINDPEDTFKIDAALDQVSLTLIPGAPGIQL